MKKIIEAHKFFVKTTPSYVGKWVEGGSLKKVNGVYTRDGYYRIPWRYKLYIPIAYIKFMYYTLTF